ncbi:MAG TPA: M14 family metallopeptidase [Vicinamibacterales bacterium]|nr:M14 family metallopeptidase [Vicinamibacterales bacterium]
MLFRQRARTMGATAAALGLAIGSMSSQAPPSDAAADAKKPVMHRVGGARDGASAFMRTDYPQVRPVTPGRIDFDHFHTYDETVDLLRTWAKTYSHIVDLYSAGQSFEGRDLWQLTITGKQTGKHTDKPAFYIEGGRHAGEISGIEATLYFIDHLLSGYGKDDAITRLIDTKTIYARPHNNPDGATLYHLTAQTLRSTVRPYDNDGDGLLDEDAGEDLDGDGFIRQMRRVVGQGKGAFVKDPKDPKGRAMRRVGDGKGDYEVYSEGVDNDGDGRYNEDGIGGLDLHRNYPENWRPMVEETGRGYTQGGAGEYPLSEPETRATFMFLMTHPNVAIVQSLDTAVPMILRGPSTSRSEESMLPSDLELIRKFDARGLEITGYPWAGDTYYVYATRGGRNPITGEDPRPTPLFGHGPDFGYAYYGTPWYGNEIWNGGRFVDYDKDGRFDEWELLRWHDEQRPGRADFLGWTPYRHPTLGEVEIGGFNPKFYLQNPPPDLLATWARNEAMFNVYLARQLPQVRIASASARRAAAADDLYDVELGVTNEGLMPTALEIAQRVKMVKPDTCTITLAKGQTLASRPEGTPAQRPSIEIGWLQPGETKRVSWQVKGAGEASLSIASTRGGVDRRSIDLR